MGKEGYAISLLIEELKAEDIKRRINSVNQLHTIATALDIRRTRKELLPFLHG